MRREQRRPKVVPRCDALEPRALLSADGPSAAFLSLASEYSALLGPNSPVPAGSSTVLVAVIDSGVDVTSTDPIHVTGGGTSLDMTDAYNAIDGEVGPPAVVDATPDKQGTRVVNQVLRGIADAVAAGGSSAVQVLPISIYDSKAGDSPFYALVGGIYHAADFGAKVIDVDAYPSRDDLTAGETQQLDQAIQYARSKGAVVVAPAGDGYGPPPTNGLSPIGVNIDQAGAGRAAYLADPHLANMLVVTATDPSGTLAGSSNWGPTHVDLGVPTGAGDLSSRFATGYASGVAAVVAATRPDWSAIDVVNRIKATVQPSGSLAGKVTTGGMISPGLALNGIAQAATPSTRDDLEGDLKADFALYGHVPGTGGYGLAVASSTQGFSPTAPTIINNGGSSLGGPGSIPVPGQYYQAGVTQPAVYGPEYSAAGKPTGRYDFAILGANPYGQYSVTTFAPGVGGAGDIPVVGDFLGDGRDDIAFYGNHDGQYNFWVLTAASNFDPTKMIILNNNGIGFGGPGSVPVVGSFFGDGKLDIAVYGPAYNAAGQYNFAALDAGSKNAAGYYTRSLYVQGIGQAGDVPIVGDYSGDGTSDLALYGKHDGEYDFQVLSSSNGFDPARPLVLDYNGYGFGGPGSVPISGDFFGDGGTDLAVFGPEFGANGQPDGLYNFAAIDPKSKNAQGQVTKSLLIKGFGGPNTIPASAPPAVKWNEAKSG